MAVIGEPVYAPGGADNPLAPLLPVIQPADTIYAGEYEELNDSPTIDFTDKGPVVTRNLIADWDTAVSLAKKLRGYTAKIGSQWVIKQPAFYSRVDGVYVTKVSIKPFTDRATADGGDTLYSRYEKAMLTVTYDMGTGDQNGGSQDDQNPTAETYITEDIEPHAEFLTVNTNSIYWADGTHVEEVEAPGVALRSFAWLYTRHKMPEIPSYMFDYMGCVNDGEVYSNTLKYTFPDETLLFDEPRISRDITSDGIQAWRVTMKMIYRPKGWNKFYRAGKPEPQYLWIPNWVATGVEKPSLEGRLDIEDHLVVYKPYEAKDFSLIKG